MKRLSYSAILLLVSFFIGTYVFIPPVISVSVYRSISSSTSGVFRTVANIENWPKWFPNQKNTENLIHFPSKTYTYQDNTFSIQKASYNNIKVIIRDQSGIQSTQLIFIPVFQDSIIINWKYSVRSEFNPIKRFLQYQQAIKIKKSMDSILLSLAHYCDTPKNVYGISIIETSTIDTQLIFKSIVTKSQPSINTIYKQINSLQLYAKEKGAEQSGYPMLNIINYNNKSYRLMTALPINKLLPETGEIVFKRMIPGRFLSTTVIGGERVINYASQQLQQYIQDYERVVMAEPFQILITDRTKETDSSKWQTKLFFPVK